MTAPVACAVNFASFSSNFVWHFAGSAGFPCSAFPFSFAWQFRSVPHSFSFFARHAGVVSPASVTLTPATNSTPATGSATPTRRGRPISFLNLTMSLAFLRSAVFRAIQRLLTTLLPQRNGPCRANSYEQSVARHQRPDQRAHSRESPRTGGGGGARRLSGWRQDRAGAYPLARN